MLPFIGERKLCELTQADLDQLAKTMRPKDSVESRKRQVYTPFITAFKAAADRDPPLVDAKRWKSPKHEKRRANSPDDAYISKLVDVADIHERRGKRKNVVTGSRKPARDMALVLFVTFTGARSGEAQRLELRDLFLDRGYAMLRRTKNGEPRQVALTPELIEALRTQVAALGDAPVDTLVFECKTRWGIPQLVKRARKRAGLDDYRPHQVGRHAFATRLLNAGASTAAVKQAGGWKSESRAFDEYYGHLAQEVTDRAVAGMKLNVSGEAQTGAQKLSTLEKSNKSAA